MSMNGFIKKTAAGLLVSAGLSSLGGCVLYRQIVDPCYPERYNYQARSSVREVANAQANAGHTLDQTVWEYFFDKDPRTGEDLVTKDAKTKDAFVTLTPGGKEHLRYIALRPPVPDPVIYLQHDVNSEVNWRRKVAIENFLTTIAPGRTFVIQEIDARDIRPVDVERLKMKHIDYKNPFVSSGSGSGGGGH